MEHRYEIRPSGLGDDWGIFHVSDGFPDGTLVRTLSTASLDALTDALVAHRARTGTRGAVVDTEAMRLAARGEMTLVREDGTAVATVTPDGIATMHAEGVLPVAAVVSMAQLNIWDEQRESDHG